MPRGLMRFYETKIWLEIKRNAPHYYIMRTEVVPGHKCKRVWVCPLSHPNTLWCPQGGVVWQVTINYHKPADHYTLNVNKYTSECHL